MGRPRHWTAEQNAKRREAALAFWRVKSRRELHREIADNADGDLALTNGNADVLLTLGQVGQMLFADGLPTRNRVKRLTALGELPVASRSRGGWRLYRLSDVARLRERVKEEAAA